MYILKHCTTGEYVACQYKNWGPYENVPLGKLKSENIYFIPNDKIKSMFSVNYHRHFGGLIPIKYLDTKVILEKALAQGIKNSESKNKHVNVNESKKKNINEDISKISTNQPYTYSFNIKTN